MSLSPLFFLFSLKHTLYQLHYTKQLLSRSPMPPTLPNPVDKSEHLFLFFWPCCTAGRILASNQGLNLGPQQWKCQVLTTKGTPRTHFSWSARSTFLYKLHIPFKYPIQSDWITPFKTSSFLDFQKSAFSFPPTSLATSQSALSDSPNLFQP